ncbi:MAG: acetyl-CoA hydrolase/transferase family protein [Crocinitomicaceae bacterium]|nr:acetyl-CoA hydrolase/transferase family protein [Crocinitomicaceae bacterium]
MKLNFINADDAVSKIKNGNRVFIQGSAATPQHLVKALMKKAGVLQNIELVSITTLGKNLFDVPDFGKTFFMNSLFVSDNVRSIVNSDPGEYVPVFLSEIHLLFERNVLPLDIALIHVSPPDVHGYCSLGTSVDITRSAVKNAKWVIAQVNEKMPRTHGDGVIHVDQINAFVKTNDDLPEISYSEKVNSDSLLIGKNCAQIIEDGSCLQLGIGAIPDAVLQSLGNHKNLGIHTEMFSDGVISLVEKGVINNSMKKNHPGELVTGFVAGTRKLYDFVHDNPVVRFLDIAYVNDPHHIRQNSKTVAINSAIEIDLTGQVCADSIGMYQFSGVGGQMDFMRGAALSEGGKPIIAMNSISKNGDSKIVPFLKQGAGVVTTRAHVHYVVTEFGVAFLFGKNLKQRAEALIEISHPNHRDWLEAEKIKRFGK